MLNVMNKLFFCVLFFVLFAQKLAVCQSDDIPPIQTDRPSNSFSPSLTAKGYLQVESGLMAEHNAGMLFFTTPTVLVKYGVNKKFELRLQSGLNWDESSSNTLGIPPLMLGIKSSLVDEKGIVPQVSFIGHISLDEVATGNMKRKYIAPDFRFAFQHTLSRKFSLLYNLGMLWDGFNASPQFNYTMYLGYSVSNRLSCFAEIYGNKDNTSTFNHYADAGFTLLMNKNSLIDLYGGLNIAATPVTNVASYYFLSCGYSFRLNTSRKVETIFVR